MSAKTIEFEHRLVDILRRAPQRLETLKILQSLALPDWAIGAGYIRAAVWDELSGCLVPSPVEDIDVLYFDDRNQEASQDQEIEDILKKMRPDLPWSVRNQARMHRRNGDRPYTSTADALSFWLETPTCVAVRLAESGHLHIMAPYGLHDLFSMCIRPTPRGHARAAEYRERIATKKWNEKWPGVTIEMP
jgi:hypothetical protein